MPQEFITNVDAADMTSLAIINAMRAIDTSIKLLNDNINEVKVSSKEQTTVSQAVVERLIRMEANSAFEEVKVLRTEMDVVKTTLSEIRGAGKFADLVHKFGPSFIIVIAVIVFYLNFHKA